MAVLNTADALYLGGPVDRVYAGPDRVWPPRPAPTFLDTFTRADVVGTLGTADTGQTWEPVNAAWGISGGRLSAPASSTTHAPTGLPNAAGEYEADLQHTSSSGRFAGLIFAALPGSTDRWNFVVDARDNFATIQRRSNSTTTTAAQATGVPIDVTQLHLRVRFDPAAGVIQAWVGTAATPTVSYAMTAGEVTKYTPALRWGVTTSSAATVYLDNMTARPLA